MLTVTNGFLFQNREVLLRQLEEQRIEEREWQAANGKQQLQKKGNRKENQKPRTLIRVGETRWLSWAFVVERLLEFEDPFFYK